MTRTARASKLAADPTVAIGAVRVSKDEQTLSPEGQQRDPEQPDIDERWGRSYR